MRHYRCGAAPRCEGVAGPCEGRRLNGARQPEWPGLIAAQQLQPVQSCGLLRTCGSGLDHVSNRCRRRGRQLAVGVRRMGPQPERRHLPRGRPRHAMGPWLRLLEARGAALCCASGARCAMHSVSVCRCMPANCHADTPSRSRAPLPPYSPLHGRRCRAWWRPRARAG